MTPRRLNVFLPAAAAVVSAPTAAAADSAMLQRGREPMQGIVACVNCHTPLGPQRPMQGMELASGLPFVEAPFPA